MKDFRELNVWHKGHALTLVVYRATAHFPREELYGLVSQIRRATSSIPANLAEGCGRNGDRDFARFVQIAMGSVSEVEYFLLLSFDLGYLSKDEQTELTQAVVEVKRMLAGLLTKLRANSR